MLHLNRPLSTKHRHYSLTNKRTQFTRPVGHHYANADSNDKHNYISVYDLRYETIIDAGAPFADIATGKYFIALSTS